MEAVLKEKYLRLKGNISRYKSAAVAFSGGVDSTLLLKTAHDVLGDKVVGFLATSPFQIPAEIDKALRCAEKIGCRLVVVDFDLASDNEFCENKANRCYYCKKKIYNVFQQKMLSFGSAVLMDGTNLDDTLQDRPGSLAIEELKVATPLKDTQFSKKEIRQISRDLGLPTWNKHSASCLATRIRTGKRVTLADIEIVSEIEQILNHDGFLGSRLKIGGNYAIVSLARGDSHRFLNSETADRIKNILKTKGFSQVFLDLSEREGILT